jgi:hypothetical protein
MKPLKLSFLTTGIIAIGCTIILITGVRGLPSTNGKVQVTGDSDSKSTPSVEKNQPREKIIRTNSFRLPVYKPPKGIGSPGGRIGGGTRGQDDLAIFALVPDHLGLTINDQPTLYWYLSESMEYPLVLTVNEETQVKPILETIITTTPQAGIQSAPLKNFNISLELGKEYQWFVSIAVDSNNPSKNVIAGGRIQRIRPPEELLVRLRNADPDQVTAIYSESGLWYDALASISDLINSRPASPDYRLGRKTLLEQVDLMEVAKAEERVAFPQDSSIHSDVQPRSVYTTFPKNSEDIN